MNRLSLLIIALFLLVSTQAQQSAAIPPFIFPELDQALIQLWLPADAEDQQAVEKAYAVLAEQWVHTREEVSNFPQDAYNPYLLVGTVDALLVHLEEAVKRPDFFEQKAIIDAIQWEFQTIREFHRQSYYPLDLWWEVQAVFVEIHDATNDPKLALLEWQELECLFDEMVCLLHDYEIRAEEHLTRYAPAVDEDAHKAAMNRAYECIESYQEALTFGYQDQLVWPCDQIAEALRTVLQCYLPQEKDRIVQ